MKLLLCLIGATLAFGQEIAPSEQEAFMKYMDGMQKIFAKPSNQRQIQDAFSSDSARQWLLSLLDKRPTTPFQSTTPLAWNDGRLMLGEFMAWYPSLAALWERFGMEPVVMEEWSMADFEPKDGEVSPIELYAMMRDSVTKPFFPSILSLLYSEATKSGPGFYNPAKKTAFESGSPFGVIAGLPSLNKAEAKAMATEVEATQGKEEEDNFMGALGMDSDEQVPVLTKEGDAVKIPVEKEEKEAGEIPEPEISKDTKVVTTTGQTVTAKELSSDEGLVAAPGQVLTVNMPDGTTQPMITANPNAPTEEGNKKAIIKDAQGKTIAMPVVESIENPDGSTSTKILTTKGSETTVTTPKEGGSAIGDADETGDETAEIKDNATGQTTTAKVEKTGDTDSDEAEIVCDGEEKEGKCAAATVVQGQKTIIVPTPTGEEGVKGLQSDTVEEEGSGAGAEGELTLKDGNGAEEKATVTKVEAKPTGKVELTAETANGQKIIMEMIGTDGDEPTQGNIKIETAQGETIATGPVSVVKTEAGIEGTANVNGKPVKVEVKMGEEEVETDGNEPSTGDKTKTTISMSVKINNEPATPVKIVKQDKETVTGELANGSKITVPKEVSGDADEGSGDPVMKVEQPNGAVEEMTILKTQTLKTGPGMSQESTIATTSTGAQIEAVTTTVEGQ